VNRVEPEMAKGMRREVLAMAQAPAADAAGFVQKDFFEFHLYTLGRKTTLPNNSTKQIELFDQAKQIPARKCCCTTVRCNLTSTRALTPTGTWAWR
jgi:hypothetical protein